MNRTKILSLTGDIGGLELEEVGKVSGDPAGGGKVGSAVVDGRESKK